MTSFSSGSSDEYDSLLSSASSTPLYNANRLPRPLSTVLEEGRSSQGTLWTEEKKDTDTSSAPPQQQQKQKHQQQSHYSGSSMNDRTSLWPSRPNIHVKRWCRLWITFAFVGIVAFLWGGLHLQKTTATTSSSHQSNGAPWVPRFDYIVVGGGPSGIIAAVKLARRFPHLSVLLLEAGIASQNQVLQQQLAQSTTTKAHDRKSLNSRSTCSSSFGSGAGGGILSTDWNKFDVPLLWSGIASSQPRSVQDIANSTVDPHLWPLPGVVLVGRGLGGGGLVNAMIAVRSLASDWERWNLTNWEFDRDVLPHFVALESFSSSNNSDIINTDATKPWRGTKGPLTTARVTNADAVGQTFVQAAVAAGWPLARDGFNSVNVTDRIGAGVYEYNIRYGVRDSVAQALLGRRSIPSNLVIRTGQTVTRLLISPTGDIRAQGVAYQTIDKQVGEYLLTDDNFAEVILAAGAILTPKLLQQSGIGPDGSVLKLNGVGANLQDHPFVAVSYRIAPSSKFRQATSIYTIGNEWEDYMSAATDLTNVNATNGLTPAQKESNVRLGSLGTAGFSAGGFLRSPWARRNDSAPDLQITVFPRVMEPHVTRSCRIQYSDKYMESSAILITVALLEADARYTVKSSMPAATTTMPQGNNWVNFEAPSIELPAGSTSYLTARDIRRLEWGVNEVRKVVGATPMKEEIDDELVPGPSVQATELRQWINESVLPNAHWVGTTRMGNDEDPSAVVNNFLTLKGTANIRIVDAGVIPGAPNGNIHTTVAAVASRGAELIAQARYPAG